MKSKKEMDKHQENSISNNQAGRSPDRELGDKGGTNEAAKKHQQVPLENKRTKVQGP